MPDTRSRKRPTPTTDPCTSASSRHKKQRTAPTAADFHQVSDPRFTAPFRVHGIHPRAEVFYQPALVPRELAERWKARCKEELAWYRPTLRVFNRDVVQSRQIAAYATTDDLKLMYSGHPVEMHHPFPPLLAEIAAHLERTLSPPPSPDDIHIPPSPPVRFNHVMANLYEDGSRYIGKHRDNRENLCIATLSLGAERRWIMERVAPRKGAKPRPVEEGEADLPQRKEWTLRNGSLLVMQGDTQLLYTHEIPKEPKCKDLRISLTFRQLINKV